MSGEGGSDTAEVRALRTGGFHAYMPFTMRRIHEEARWVLPILVGFFVVLAVLAKLRALPWDRPILNWIVTNRTNGLNDFFKAFTRLGGYDVVVVVVVVCALAAWWRSRALAIAIVTLAIVSPLVVAALKDIVARPRPPIDLAVSQPGGFSFPSGHPLAVAASWGFIPLVLALYVKRRWVWWTSVAVVWALVVLIAASRVYLAAHWTTDVVASLTLAVIFVAGSEVFIDRIHRFAAQRSERRSSGTASYPGPTRATWRAGCRTPGRCPCGHRPLRDARVRRCTDP